MKTDSLFYLLFQALPEAFFELLNQPTSLANAYSFASVEVKQTAKRIDGVFVPKVETSNDPIYFVEVQFQLDPKLYARLFSEIFVYLAQTNLTRNWFAVIIYPSSALEPDLTVPFQVLLNSPQVIRVYLDELGDSQSIGINTLKLINEPQLLAIPQAKKLINQVKQLEIEASNKRDLLELIETIIVYKFPRDSREEIEAMLGLGELKQTRVYQEAKEEGKQEGLEEGKQQGKQQGKQEGLQEGKLKAVPLLLSAGISVAQIAQSLELPEEEVRKIAEQL